MQLISGFFNLIIKLILLVVILCVIAIGYGAGVEPGMTNVTVTKVDSDRWPSFWQSLTVVVVSDLHIGSPHVGVDRVADIVATVNARDPDMVFLLGDYMPGDYFDSVDPSSFAPVLGNLQATHGVFAVLGEHDWRTGDNSVAKALAGAGITVLNNQVASVTVAKGRRFWILGLADQAAPVKPDYEKMLARVPRKEPIFALAHNPVEIPRVKRQLAMGFAGHTHGGLVHLPFAPQIALVPTDVPANYARGLIDAGGQTMYVTSGIGSGSIPIRLNVRPEISVVMISGE